MPPRASKPSPASPAPVDETRKIADALWLFEQFLHCDPPVILNVTPISETTRMKPNTIVKRINTMQHRYPGFGIVTRTTGARQSSNLAPVTPVKKFVGKGTGRRTGKKVEAIEEDEEDGGKRQTRARKLVGGGVSDKKIKTNDDEDQAQTSTDDEDSDVPPTPSTKKPSKKTKPQKKSTSKQPLPKSSDDDTDASEQSDGEEEPPAKKIATPKTRGGRKSAGIGEIKDLRAYPEKPVPRGRHAIPKKEKVADANITKADAVPSDNEDSGKNDAGDHTNGNKRKRSETAESQSSPLTHSPAVKQRLVEMDSMIQGEKEGSHANELNSSDMPPPPKKQKKNHDSIVDNIDTETMVQEGISSAAQETPEAQPVTTTNQEDTGTKVGESQSLTEVALDAGPSAAAEPEQDVDKSMTTPLGQNIDEVPDASNEVDGSGEHTAEVDRVMEAPESPTAGRGRPVKSITETVTKITAVSIPEATANEATTMRPKVVEEIEILPDAIASDVQEPSSAILTNNIQDIPTEDTSTQEPAAGPKKAQGPNNTDAPVIPKGSRSIPAEHSQDPKGPGQSKSKKQFSHPLEWMIWNPTAKPTKSKYAIEVGRVLP